ncbi:MAG TPA: 4-alpha-glucanotransferase [Ktedonobacterales bacterium]|nr:4-alpha-glucanotransferase [Ktedonobacterales bacterium]
MKRPRASGILAHPTSLPGRFAVGDLGPGTNAFLDFLAASRQQIWQVLPLGPTGYGDSPYALLSAFAGNPLLISPELLLDEHLLAPDDLADAPTFDPAKVDYGVAIPWKMALLQRSHQYFREHGEASLQAEYQAFCDDQHGWLNDYALFMALKAQFDGKAWTDWPRTYALRDEDTLASARRALADEIAFHRYTQFLFFRQWLALRASAHARNIRIMGDLAIFVAHDSADVWAHRDLFYLDDSGRPTVVAGVPPDYFSETGQRWGNPIYRWDVAAKDGYSWWVARVRQALQLEDILRLDHFRGFEAYWEIPGDAETAVKGQWVPGPGAALFTAIRRALGRVPFVAEDLGVITPEVVALRRQMKFPGMRVLQFGFGDGAENEFLPHNYTRNTVVYTGTHDNDTTRGWFESLTKAERRHVVTYLHSDERHIVWDMIRAAEASVARIAILPLQDPLELGNAARMNYPSKPAHNWTWRCPPELLTPAVARRLAELATLYGRWPKDT